LVQVCLSSAGVSLLQFCWSKFASDVLVEVCFRHAGPSLLQFCWSEFSAFITVY